MPIDDSLRRIFADIFQVPVDSIQPDSSPETISSWDSLQHLNLVLALEQEFGIQFSPDEIETLISPERVAALIITKLSAVEVYQCQ